MAGQKSAGQNRREHPGKEGAPREVLLYTPEGRVLEGLYTNIFLCLEGQWVTPDLHNGLGLEGVAKQSLVAHAKTKGVTIKEAEVSIPSLHRAESIWLTNGLVGVVPVTSYGERQIQSASPWTTDWSSTWASRWLP